MALTVCDWQGNRISSQTAFVTILAVGKDVFRSIALGDRLLSDRADGRQFTAQVHGKRNSALALMTSALLGNCVGASR